MDWLFFLRRETTRVLADFQRLNVNGKLVEVRKWGKEPELRLRLQLTGKGEKPFADIRFTDGPKVEALLSDAERWIRRILVAAEAK